MQRGFQKCQKMTEGLPKLGQASVLLANYDNLALHGVGNDSRDIGGRVLVGHSLVGNVSHDGLQVGETGCLKETGSDFVSGDLDSLYSSVANDIAGCAARPHHLGDIVD